MSQELPDVQGGFRKGRGNRDPIANICWIIEKARELQKNIYFCITDILKPLTVWITINWKILKKMYTRPPYLFPEKPVCRSRSKLEPDMEQGTGFKTGRGICQG